MKLRGVLMLLVSLVLAGVVAFSANRWMTKRLASASGDSVKVVAAASEIPFGTKIDATVTKMIDLPVKSVPDKAFRDQKAVIGRVAAFTLYKGEILVEGRVVEHVGGSALAAVVEEGKRAVTVRVNDVVGVAGFLLPGNRVDVIATRRASGGDRGMQSRTLLENLKVLAVDQTSSPDKNEPVIVRAVTLEADPAQSEEIVRATEEGKVQLTLRNPLDGVRREIDPKAPATAAASAPVAAQEKPATPPQSERTEVVVVIRGVKPTLEPTGGDFGKTLELAR